MRDDPTAMPFEARMVVLASLSAVFQIAAIVPVPFVVREIVDDLVTSDSGSTRRLLALGVAVIVLQLVSAAGTVGVRSVVARTAAAHGARLRRWMHDAMVQRPVMGLRTTDDATLLQATINLPTRIEEGANLLLGQVVPSVLTIIGVFAVMVALDWQLALALLLMFPLLTLAQRIGRARMRQRLAQRSDQEASAVRTTLSLIERIETVRTPETADAERQRFEDRNQGLQSASAAVQRDRSVLITSNTTAVVIAVTVLLILGSLAIDAGRLGLGQFLAFYAGVAILRAPAQSLGTAIPVLESAGDARALLRSLDTELGPPPPAGGRCPQLASGIEVRDVHFAYGRDPVLEGVDLRIERGRLTALVGANGAGKTSLVHLILGLYEPSGGRIEADGVPYTELDTARLRSQIGVSFQRGALAEASVLDNITYGRSFDADEVAEAIELADLGPVIDELDDGLHTVVGPGGRRLSRGQEQRIELARAAVGRPPVLILDEPTNHLDPAAVSQFLARLIDQPQRPAILVVSHDRRALDLADTIVELRNGRVREIGATRGGA